MPLSKSQKFDPGDPDVSMPKECSMMIDNNIPERGCMSRPTAVRILFLAEGCYFLVNFFWAKYPCQQLNGLDDGICILSNGFILAQLYEIYHKWKPNS